MKEKLYELALWYIGKCNAKWYESKREIETLSRVTYKGCDKYYLLYGADDEWRKFGRYDVLDNAIQRLANYENIGTVEEFKAWIDGNKPKDTDVANAIYDAVTNELIKLGTDLDVNQAIQEVILDFMY